MTTGQKIKYYRESKKMSQKELGILLNKSQGTVAKYENDTAEMDYATLKKFCDYAGCTIDYLLGRTEESENEIRKAPPESDADEYETNRKNPELTPDEIRAIKELLRDQGL